MSSSFSPAKASNAVTKRSTSISAKEWTTRSTWHCDRMALARQTRESDSDDFREGSDAEEEDEDFIAPSQLISLSNQFSESSKSTNEVAFWIQLPRMSDSYRREHRDREAIRR